MPLKLPPLGPVETKQLCYSVLTEEQRAHFEKHNELDLSFGVKGLSRFRANIYMQRGAVAGAFRTIPFKILTFEELGPAAGRRRVREEAERPGARHRAHRLRQDRRRSRRSSTRSTPSSACHIITIEDPIEYLHPHKLCDRQPARGGHRHRGLQERAQVRPAAGPGRKTRSDDETELCRIVRFRTNPLT